MFTKHGSLALQVSQTSYADKSNQQSDMGGIAKYSVGLIALGLLIYFITKVVIAIDKLQDEKVTAVSTRKYEHERLFPSISICFRKTHYSNLSDHELVLNISRQVLNDHSNQNHF